MTQGRVAWYCPNLGYDFILPENGGMKAFVRRKDIVAGEEENLENNARVSYEVTQGTEGPEAMNVYKA